MDIHQNARSCPASRLLLVSRIRSGSSVSIAAEAVGISRRTAFKWLARYRAEGKTGLLEARLCREGRARVLEFCDEHRIPYALTGKLMVAVRESERQRLAEIRERGRLNGVDGLELVGPEGIAAHEPHATGLAALWVPTAGIVDYPEFEVTVADGIPRQRACPSGRQVSP